MWNPFLALSLDTTTDASRSSGASPVVPARQWLWLGFSARFLTVVAVGEHCYARCPVVGFGHATGAPSDWHGCLRARSLLYLRVPRCCHMLQILYGPLYRMQFGLLIWNSYTMEVLFKFSAALLGSFAWFLCSAQEVRRPSTIRRRNNKEVQKPRTIFNLILGILK
ncbi:hypothetical protein VPH35_030893 [Triticum aestivum]